MKEYIVKATSIHGKHGTYKKGDKITEAHMDDGHLDELLKQEAIAEAPVETTKEKTSKAK
jgi:hypothetical protein